MCINVKQICNILRGKRLGMIANSYVRLHLHLTLIYLCVNVRVST